MQILPQSVPFTVTANFSLPHSLWLLANAMYEANHSYDIVEWEKEERSDGNGFLLGSRFGFNVEKICGGWQQCVMMKVLREETGLFRGVLVVNVNVREDNWT